MYFCGSSVFVARDLAANAHNIAAKVSARHGYLLCLRSDMKRGTQVPFAYSFVLSGQSTRRRDVFGGIVRKDNGQRFKEAARAGLHRK